MHITCLLKYVLIALSLFVIFQDVSNGGKGYIKKIKGIFFEVGIMK